MADAPTPLRPRRLRGRDVRDVRALTAGVLSELIRFKTTHDLLAFVRDEGVENYADLELRLHEGYPIGATAVSATRTNLNGRPYAVVGGFLHDDLPLSPESVSGRLWMYPMEAASAAYAFALFEMHGQALADLLWGGPSGGSWHRKINDRSDLSSKSGAALVRQKFADDINVPASRVRLRFLRDLRTVKAQRNQIVHEGRHPKRFDAFYIDLLRLICRLHFIAVPGDRHVIVCPWPDHDGVIARPPGPGVFSHVSG